MNTGRNTGRIISAWGFSFLFSEQPQWTSSRRETKSDGLVEHQKEPQSTRSLFKPSLPLLNPPLPLSVSPVFLALETHAPADPHFTHTHTHKCGAYSMCVNMTQGTFTDRKGKTSVYEVMGVSVLQHHHWSTSVGCTSAFSSKNRP